MSNDDFIQVNCPDCDGRELVVSGSNHYKRVISCKNKRCEQGKIKVSRSMIEAFYKPENENLSVKEFRNKFMGNIGE